MATSPTDLTTVGAVAAYMAMQSPITPNTTAQLQQLVSAASLYITTYCSVDNFNSATYTETLSGNGRDRVFTRNWPITAVSSVTVNGQAIPASTGFGSPGYLFDNTSILIRPGQGSAMAMNFNVYPGSSWFFYKGIANVVVTYTAGFTTIPADLAQCAIEIAATSYVRSQNVYKKSIGSGVAGAHGTTDFGLEIPLMCQQTIRNYQRVWSTST
jgi:hypothetical protein